MGPSFSMDSCGFEIKPSIRCGSRPTLRTARSSCRVAFCMLGNANSFGIVRPSPGQNMNTFFVIGFHSPGN